MEEQKEKDVAVGSGSESTVDAGGHVAGETLTGSEAHGVDAQVQGDFPGEVEEDDGGPCSGDDIMVEVLGSNVYVGGVCTSGDGEESSDGEVDRDKSVEVEMGSEGNAKTMGGDGGSVPSGETEVMDIEEAEEVGREEASSENVDVSYEQAKAENGNGGFVVGSLGSESPVLVSEVAVKETVEVSGRRLVEVVEQEKKLVVGVVDAPNDLKTQKAGVSDDEVWNPGIEQVSVTVDEEDLNPEPLSEQSQVSAAAAACDVTGVRKGEILASKVSGKDTEKIDQNSSHPVEQHVKVERVGGSSHSRSNVPVHPVSSSLPVQVGSGAEFAVTSAHDLLNSEETVENMVHDIALVRSLPAQLVPGGVVSLTGQHLEQESIERSGSQMEVDSQVNNAEQVGLDEGPGKDLVSNSDAVESTERDQPVKSGGVLHGAELIEDITQDTIKTETVCRSSETDIQVADVGDIAPMDTLGDSHAVHEVGVIEHVTDAELDGLHGGQYMDVEKEAGDNGQQKEVEEEILTLPGSSKVVPHPRYELPVENEGVFSASDLVWGKVKSHPWWPGQIFDYTVASERAMKYHKKDCFLVAYFGDRTFAWNEPSTLKPFRSHFLQLEKQCNSEGFQNAVNCALDEVSRRVELGLACSCLPRDVYEKIKLQIVENAGISQESCRRDEVDESANASSLECNKLLEYVKLLAQFPSGGSDRLELVIAKAHLLAISRLKGYCSLPEFQFGGDLVENDRENSVSGDKTNTGEGIEHLNPSSGPGSTYSHKRKHGLREGVYSKIREISLSELVDGDKDSSLHGYDWSDGKDTGVLVSPSSGKRRKGVEYHTDDLTAQDGRKPIPKQSFKIGECIQRAANQLTASPIVKSNSDRPGVGSDGLQSSGDAHVGKSIDPTEYSSLDELLSQLQTTAEDPRRDYHFLKTIVNFFSDFRNSVAIGQHPWMELSGANKVGGRKRKASNSVLGVSETFDFDDMNDTYWTDRVIQNGAEEQPSRRGRKMNYQPVVLAQTEKTPQEGRRKYSRRQYSQANQALTVEKPVGYVDENAPAELVMNFSEVNSVPSETKLNKMFRRFGPLREYETEVDRESSRARVVFKRCSDAEIACNSAGKFNIFGPIVVTYQLNYTLSQLNYIPSFQFSGSPSATTHDQEMQLVLPSHDHEMHLDLSTHDQMQLDLSTHDQMQLDLSTHDQLQLDLSTHDQMQLDLSTFDVSLVRDYQGE